MGYEDQLEYARDLNNEGRYEEAAALLKKIESKGNKSAQWHYRLAYALLHTNHFAEAIGYLERAIVVDPTYPFSYSLLAMLYYWQGELVKAFTTAQDGRQCCLVHSPDDVWEFDTLLYDMYLQRPFVSQENWRDSVLSNEFPDYDASADASIKRQDKKKAQEELLQYYGRYPRPYAIYTIFINACLQPKHRQELYEQQMDFLLAMQQLGQMLHGGTFVNDKNLLTGCDMSFEVYTDVPNYHKRFMELLERFPFPKGSGIVVTTPEGVEVRTLRWGNEEILALGLDTLHLDPTVYAQHTVNALVEALLQKMNHGYLISYQDGKGYTWIYFMGKSYLDMYMDVVDILNTHPLCVDCIVKEGTTPIRSLKPKQIQ